MIHQRAFALGLLSTTALVAVAPAMAQSLPTGANVSYGSVGFQRSSGSLTVNQSSQNAIVNYNSFSIGKGNSVTFNQPNSSSVILNRVTGTATSTIAGTLSANGQVYLVNPNGIAITKTGVVKVGGGFVASSLGMSDEEFKSGRHKFKGAGASANVSNAGVVTIGRGGYAALIGGSVTNSGMIAVPMGKVGLGSGEAATLDVSGDGFLQVAVPTASHGKAALIQNSGTISAAGGTVVLNAATARAAARNAVNISGTIDAHSISGRSGAIYIGGGPGGAVHVSGRLRVASKSGHGGSVTISGRTIALTHAVVDASGKTGGGTVKIGGDLHGGGTLGHADTVTIDAKSIITADATGKGDGGNIVVWSDETTSFAGLISAKGGAQGGDGGQVEVSSHGVLNDTGLTKLTAANGTAGTLLLDPYDVVISSGTDTNGSFDGASPTSTYTATGTSVISVATLQTQLANSNVTITTAGNGADAGNITIAAPITWSTGNLLTLTASNAIAVDANISITGGGQLALNTATTTIGSITQPLLSFAQGASVSYATGQSGQALSINGTSYTLEYSMAGLQQLNSASAHYALATSLTSTGTYTTGVIPNFKGTLEGLGNTISNLTINDSNPYGSFIGQMTGGTVRDIGLVGVNISGASPVKGALVAYNVNSDVIQSYATGTVSGTQDVGGLVGYAPSGTITQSYATAAVSGTSTAIGGLVGYNSGTITYSYATGAVNGSTQQVGGLVGYNFSGTITQAYATGAVSGPVSASAGGLVGTNYQGTITNAYWDMTTAGASLSGVGGDNNSNDVVTGLTTAQLQGAAALPDSGTITHGTHLGGAFAGGANGLYPYLSNFFPNGVQAVSGTVYGVGGAPLASGPTGAVSVTVTGANTVLGTAATGANGYYYVFGQPGTVASGAAVIGYTTANTSTGATNAAGIAASTYNPTSASAQSGVDIVESLPLTSGTTSQTTYSGYLASVGGVLPTAPTVPSGAAVPSFLAGATPTLAAMGSAGFTIDQAVDVANSFVVRTIAAGAPLTVAAPVTVQSGGSLALSAAGALAIDAPITANGAASVSLAYDQTTTTSATDLSFGLIANEFAGSLSYTGTGGALAINGTSYALEYSLAALTSAANTTPSGAFALATSVDGSNGGSGYTDAPITSFSGTFEGLGNTISNLTIAGANSNAAVGLFGAVSGGTVRDIGLVGGTVSGADNYSVGALVGFLTTVYNGTPASVVNVFASTTVSGGTSAQVGGLVGEASTSGAPTLIAGSDVTGLVTAGQYSDAGGLVGRNFASSSAATIAGSYATGAVTTGASGLAGGLVGFNYAISDTATITNSYATGAVTGGTSATVGGLVGENFAYLGVTASIANSYATGAVGSPLLSYYSNNTLSAAGGLVGKNSASGSATISNVFATGAVAGAYQAGGLVGQDSASGFNGTAVASITNAYATGAVSATVYGSTGGLIGLVQASAYNGSATATLSNAYSTGVVAAPVLNNGQTAANGSYGWFGGSIGQAVPQSSGVTISVSNLYWDTATSGQGGPNGIGDDAVGNLQGNVVGVSTSALQSTATTGVNLGSAFSGGAAGFTNGLYPYLTSFFSSGLQAVSGVAYTDAGTTAAASGANGAVTVSLDANGGLAAQATTGANGYYYIALPNGALSNGGALVVSTSANASTGATNSATLTTSAGATVQTGVNLYGNTVVEPTSATLLSAVPNPGSVAGTGTDSVAAAAIVGAAGRDYVTTGASFKVDQSVTTGASFSVSTATGAPLTVAAPVTITGGAALSLLSGGTLTVAAPVTMTGGGALSLLSGGALAINAPVKVDGASAVALAYDATSTANLSFGLTGSGFAGGITFANADGSAATSGAGTLSVNGTPYTLLYTMADVANVNTLGLGGTYAIATNIDASASVANPYTTGVIAGGDNTGAKPTAFSGILEGLGHTISNLTISTTAGGDPGAYVPTGYVGLVGESTGTVRDIGMLGGSIVGSARFSTNVGDLVGNNDNVVTQAYATGAVSGSGYVGGLVGANSGYVTQAYATGAVIGNNSVGGLAGRNFGTITQTYATGSVSGTSGGLAYGVGGLVGDNNGIVTQAYATGAVSGNVTQDVGGLVGLNGGEITQAYATGAVISNGSSDVGGLVGINYSSIANGYYDWQTTGQTAGTQGDGSIGLSTAQLQGTVALPDSGTIIDTNHLGTVFAGGTGGLYPYLSSFFPNGVQVISGTAYATAGTTPASGATIGLVAGGTSAGTVTTGANGYYYAMVPNGTIDTVNGTSIVAFMPANAGTGTQNGATLAIKAVGNVSGLNVDSGWLIESPDASIGSVSALDTFYAAAAGSSAAANLTFANRQITTGAANFVIDQAQTETGTLALSSSGIVTQSAAITAGSLLLGGTGSYTLTGTGNAIGTVAATAASLALADTNALTVGSVSDANGTATEGVATTTTASLATAGNLTIASGAAVTGTDVTLAATGAFINNAGSGAISASDRWLVYSANSTGDTFDGLNSTNTAIWDTAAGGSVSATGNRYVFAEQPVLTVTTIDATKTYGADATNAVASDYTIAGVQAGVSGAYLGDTASSVYSGTASVTSVGSAETVGVGGYAYTLGQGTVTAGLGYTVALANTGTLTVNPAALTVTAATESRSYGDANPALSYTIGGSGLFNGDTLTGALTTTATVSSNVGAYAIGQGSLAASSNYTLNYVGANLTIAKRAITVTATAETKAYGNANPTLAYTTTSLGSGAALTGVLATTASATSNVGVYGITAGTLTAAANPNYALTYVGGNLTIAKRAITVTATAETKTYGNSNPTLAYTTTSLGSGAALTGVLATTASATSNVGVYGITAGTLTAAANPNYALTYVGGNLTIAKRAVTVTATAETKAYGNANPTLAYTTTSLGSGAALTGVLATTASATSNVGVYGITAGTLTAAANPNYALTYVGGNLTIAKRAITVTATAETKTYGNANPTLAYTTTSLGSGAALTGVLATTATATSNVGAYGITAGTLTAAANPNYALTYVGGNLTIAKRAITVTATAETKTYGNANPTLAYTTTSLGSGAALTGVLATTATATSNVGTYGITAGTLTAAANPNYTLTYKGANLTITQAALTITADSLAKTYGSTVTLGTTAVTEVGLRNGDTISGVTLTSLGAAATATVAGSPYAITASAAKGAHVADYIIKYVAGTLTVKPASITVTASGGTSVFGTSPANPGLSATGLQNGQSVSVLTGLTNSFGITKTSAVKSYNLTVLGNLTNANYTVTTRKTGTWVVTTAKGS